ncbi:MAG: 2-oxoacid:ferredoxin oxidoreductase subunit beta, partial [Calditrichia bacterium]
MSEVKTVNRKQEKLKKEDFSSDQEVRWCPGCGDYAILAQIRKVLPELGVSKEKTVFVSGIGCSSRFPYYVDTYGFHTIHGRAPTVATGIKLANPDLSVWLITGDGDGLSIGGNHLIHLMRRNLNVNIILFNNQIYGLTKGQFSPTSPAGKVTKSTPYGSVSNPFNPVSIALTAGASFVARTIDRHTKHMAEIFKQAAQHKGTSFVEVYQNCNIFNDGIYRHLTDAESKFDNVLVLEHGKPLIYGKNDDKGLYMDCFNFLKRDIKSDSDRDILHIHDQGDPRTEYAYILSELTEESNMPTPIGVFRKYDALPYDEKFHQQIEEITRQKGKGNLKQLFLSGDTWK